MRYKIGIFGSNVLESEQAVSLAQELGYELVKKDCIVITGACSGMPYAVAIAAKQKGAEIWGFTPARDMAEQKSTYPYDDITIYSQLFYVPQYYKQFFYPTEETPPTQDWNARLKYRNVISTINANAGIIVSGGWGTLNEFTNLIYEGKPVGVLTGTGGLADELPQWFPRLRKKSDSKVLFSNAPTEIVASLINELESGDLTR